MATWIGFLRAINLGANRKFPKGDLKAAVEAAGGTEVETYINTGNVRFTSTLTSRPEVEAALEEARHMTFARDEVERMLPTLNRAQLVWHQAMLAQTSFMVARALVNPQVYAAVGLDPREARRAALANPHYQDTMAWMGERVTGYLDGLGLIPGHQRRLWRRSLLMR